MFPLLSIHLASPRGTFGKLLLAQTEAVVHKVRTRSLSQMGNIFELLFPNPRFAFSEHMERGKRIKVKSYGSVDKFDLDIHCFTHKSSC